MAVAAPMTRPSDHADADGAILLIRALAWVCADDRRARRFLDLTGLTAEALRGHAGDPATGRAVSDFLAQYEPDLIACAEAIGVAPAVLAAARP